MTRADLQQAQAAHRAGRLSEAEALYRRALAGDPNNAELMHMLGAVRCQQGDASGAILLIQRAIEKRPDSAPMYVNLGAAYRDNREPAKAIQAQKKALALQPKFPAALVNLGHAQRDLGHVQEAIASYRACLSADPANVAAHLSLGDSLKTEGRFEEAAEAYDTAMTYDPLNLDALRNIAGILQRFGWFHSSLALLARAAEAAPRNADLRRDYAVELLRLGRLAEGWAEFEHRFEAQAQRILRRPSPPAYWTGEDLASKNILVWTEQGVGDEILYASIFPDVIARARQCVIACSPRMMPIFRRSFPAATITASTAGDSTLTPDFQIAAGSLGRYLRPDFESFPQHAGYLKADAEQVRKFRERYRTLAGDRRIVGIAWRSPAAEEGPRKSIDMAALAPILQTPGIMFVCLQYGDCGEDLATARRQHGIEIVHDVEVDALTDIDTYFAQVAAMDLVVSTSNTAAHVAGAQGLPLWLILPNRRGLLWYWFLARGDSPWYRSAKLFRDTDADLSRPWWEGVVARVADDLRRWLPP